MNEPMWSLWIAVAIAVVLSIGKEVFDYFRYGREVDNFKRMVIGDMLDQPFYNTMTVDEMTEKYMQYIGDDSDIALNCLDGKQEAKSHIRSIFV